VRKADAPRPGGDPGARTHSPLPVRIALAAAADASGPLPALVARDHWWVCGAGQLSIETMGSADTDDPVPIADKVVSVVVSSFRW
jgi:hypothetical protein